MEKFAVNKDIKKAKRWVGCGSDKVISRRAKKAHRKAYKAYATLVKNVCNDIEDPFDLDMFEGYVVESRPMTGWDIA
jgi:hypothetical protein